MNALRLALYLCVARWLPRSTMPGGAVWTAIRRALVAPLLAEAGARINVERGAYFGKGPNMRVGSRSGLGVNCHIYGPVTIGNDVMMGPDVAIYTTNHRFEDTTRPMIEQGLSDPVPVTIGDDVWIGRGVTILPGITVGSHSIIGAGAVVTKAVEPWAIVGGNPARVIGSRQSPRSAAPIVRTAAPDVEM